LGIARLLLLASAIFVLYLVLFAPARLRRIGWHAERVGFAYVVAVLLSAALRHYFGWGT
jgi:hypothetical protein